MKKILDACCGSRMFWFDRQNPDVIFADNREVETTLCDGRSLLVKPDVHMDFRDMPYPDDSFKIVVFDPPHLIHAGTGSWLRQKIRSTPGRLANVPESWFRRMHEGTGSGRPACF